MTEISGHTTPYAVLGHPIGHTLSPIMHNRAFESLGLDAIYLAFDVHPERLIPVLEGMRDMGFGGVNLTVPLKEYAFRGLNDLDDTASLVGAVNTVQFTKDGMRGHNTDGTGFLLAVEESFSASVEGLSVFVLGCGGAGRALALTCAVNGAAKVGLTDIDSARIASVALEVSARAPGCVVEQVPSGGADAVASSVAADLVIQSTPVGMKPEDPSLLPAAAFRSGQMVFDLVYMYPETALMRTARGAGAQAANGLGMLLHQGAHAFTIWTGRSADVDAMRKALEGAVYG